MKRGLAKLQKRSRWSPSSLVIIPLFMASLILIALVGNPDIMVNKKMDAALLLILNNLVMGFIIIFGIIFELLYVIKRSDNIIIGNIDGTNVLYQIYKEDRIVSDTRVLFNSTKIRII